MRGGNDQVARGDDEAAGDNDQVVRDDEQVPEQRAVLGGKAGLNSETAPASLAVATLGFEPQWVDCPGEVQALHLRLKELAASAQREGSRV